jgi:dCTP deaminase
MTILSDRQILKLIEEKNTIYVKKGPEINTDVQLGSASFDLRLGYSFRVLDMEKTTAIDTKDMSTYKDLTRKKTSTGEEGIVVHPNEFILASTLETIKVPRNMVGRVEGRSSYARLGIIPHAAAGYLDPGFEGQVTLEMQNLGNAPVIVYPEERICQLVFETLTEEPEKAYYEKRDSKYMNQEGATPSKLDKEKR